MAAYCGQDAPDYLSILPAYILDVTVLSDGYSLMKLQHMLQCKAQPYMAWQYQLPLINDLHLHGSFTHIGIHCSDSFFVTMKAFRACVKKLRFPHDNARTDGLLVNMRSGSL